MTSHPHFHFTPNLDCALNELDDLCVQLSLPATAGVAAVHVAVLARLADGELAAGQPVTPGVWPEVRADRLTALGGAAVHVHHAIRVQLGFNAQTDAVMARRQQRIDLGAQAGRGWARFLRVQAELTTRLDREPRRLPGDVFVSYSAVEGDNDDAPVDTRGDYGVSHVTPKGVAA